MYEKNISIRPIEKADLVAISGMIAKLADHIRQGFIPLTTADDLDRYGPTGFKLFEAMIAIRDDKPVGFCLYTYVFSGWRGRPGIFINDLYVELSERGTGLGQTLVHAVADKERSKGCSFVRLEVDKNNVAAKSFYVRLGFKKMQDDDLMILEIDSSK